MNSRLSRSLVFIALSLLLSCDRQTTASPTISATTITIRDFGELSQSRVRHAMIVDDSTIVAVFDPGHEILVVRANKTVQPIGKRGDGPGEFRDLAWIARDENAGIVALDAAKRVLSRWSLDGQLLGEVKVDFPYLAGVWNTTDGAVIRSHNRSQTEVVYYRVDFATGTVVPWRRVATLGDNYETCRYCYAAVASNGRIAMTAPDTLYRIAVWSVDGNSIATVERAVPRVQFAPEERDSVLDMRANAAREAVASGIPAATVQAMVASRPDPRWKPRFVSYGVSLDSSGTLFVQPNVSRDSNSRVDVFAPQSQFCGSIILGQSSRLLDMTPARLLVVRYAENGTEQLALLDAPALQKVRGCQHSRQ